MVQGEEPDPIFGRNIQITKEQIGKHKQQRSMSVSPQKGSGQFPKLLQLNQVFQKNCYYRIDTAQHSFLRDQ